MRNRRVIVVLIAIGLLAAGGVWTLSSTLGLPNPLQTPAATTAASFPTSTLTSAPTSTPTSAPTFTPTSVCTSTPTPRPTATPTPTASPSPTPISEAEVLQAYRAWLDTWKTGEYAEMTADEALRGTVWGACREYPTKSSPRIIEIVSAPTPTARLFDSIDYYNCEFGRRPAHLDGEFTLVKKPAGWVVTRWWMPKPTQPPAPTRDPNAPTAPPRPTIAPWDPYSFTRRVLAAINQLRAERGLGALEYGDQWQGLANDIARRYHETGTPMPPEEILNSWRTEVQTQGGFLGPMHYDSTLQNTRGCDRMPPDGLDPVEAFRHYEMIYGQFRYMVVGYWGPYDGDCGPAVTQVLIGIW